MCLASHQAVEFEDLVSGKTVALDAVKSQRAYLISGIGNPKAFFKTVQSLDVKVVYHAVMPDHYLYTEADVAGFCNETLSEHVECFIVTQKDAVKLKRMFDIVSPKPIYVLKIALKILDNEDQLKALVQATVKAKTLEV